MMDILDTSPKNGIKFNNRGTPIDPELRPLWRISLIALILKKLCSGNKANIKKLQVLYSLVAYKKKRESFILLSQKSSGKPFINIRFDPLLDRGVDIGIGEKIFYLDEAKSISLTPKGISFANRVEKDINVFELEKNFINQFKKSYFTDKIINELLTGDLL